MSTENKSLKDLLMALITKTNDNANIFPSTKELMQAKNLVEGQYVICLGYNSIEDGCRTTFKIVKGEATEDPYNPNLKLTGSPGLRAELVIENDTINMLQLGGRPMSPDSIDNNGNKDANYQFDNKPAFQRYIDLIRRLKGAKYKLYIPPGVWCTSPVNITCPVYIEGFQSSWEQLHNFNSTTIAPMGDQPHIFALRPYFDNINDNQSEEHEYTEKDRRYSDYNAAYDYYKKALYGEKTDLSDAEIQKIQTEINDQTLLCPQVYTLKNLVFSSGKFEYQENTKGVNRQGYYKAYAPVNYKVTHSALRLHNTNFGTFDNISFHHVVGRCMTIKTCWELRFTGNFCILECCNPGDALISFLPVDVASNGYQLSSPNISNIEMYNVNIESTIGDIFKAEYGCTWGDTLIQNIHIEPGYTSTLFTYADPDNWGYKSRLGIRDEHLKKVYNPNPTDEELPPPLNIQRAVMGAEKTLRIELANLTEEELNFLAKNDLESTFENDKDKNMQSNIQQKLRAVSTEKIANSLEHRLLSAAGREWTIWEYYMNLDQANPATILDKKLPRHIEIPKDAWSFLQLWCLIYNIPKNDKRISTRITNYKLTYGDGVINELLKNMSQDQLNETILQQSSLYSFMQDEFKYYQNKAQTMSIFNIQGTSNFTVNNFIVNNIAYRKWAYVIKENEPVYYTYNSFFTISEPDLTNVTQYDGYEYIGLGVNVGNIEVGGIFDKCSILKTEYDKISRTSYFTLDSCGYSATADSLKDGELTFDIKNFPVVICKGSIRNLAATPICPLSNDFNPCYKHSQAINSGAKSGFLCYDKDSINDLKLVVQPKNTFCNCMAFTVKNNKLNIRAKIPNNKQVTLNLYGNSDMTDNITGPITLQGSGTYAWYSIDLSTIDFAHKYYRDMNLSDGSTRKYEINRNNNPIIYIRVQPPKVGDYPDKDMLDGDNIKAFFDVFYLGEDTWYETPPSTT